MEKESNIFERYEQKYIVDKTQKALLEQAFMPYMEKDLYYHSLVRSIYLDTENHRLIRKSLEGETYKEKIRIRSYKTTGDGDLLFLELKKKYKGKVYKRRIEVGEQALIDWLNNAKPLPESQIAREIEYFKTFYGDLHPDVFISACRTSYVAKKDAGLRITFDEDVKWRDADLTFKKDPYGDDLLDKNACIMEVKTGRAYPLWLCELLSGMHVYHRSFSKCGEAYKIRAERNKKKPREMGDELCQQAYSTASSMPLIRSL